MGEPRILKRRELEYHDPQSQKYTPTDKTAVHINYQIPQKTPKQLQEEKFEDFEKRSQGLALDRYSSKDMQNEFGKISFVNQSKYEEILLEDAAAILIIDATSPRIEQNSFLKNKTYFEKLTDVCRENGLEDIAQKVWEINRLSAVFANVGTSLISTDVNRTTSNTIFLSQDYPSILHEISTFDKQTLEIVIDHHPHLTAQDREKLYGDLSKYDMKFSQKFQQITDENLTQRLNYVLDFCTEYKEDIEDRARLQLSEMDREAAYAHPSRTSTAVRSSTYVSPQYIYDQMQQSASKRIYQQNTLAKGFNTKNITQKISELDEEQMADYINQMYYTALALRGNFDIQRAQEYIDGDYEFSNSKDAKDAVIKYVQGAIDSSLFLILEEDLLKIYRGEIKYDERSRTLNGFEKPRLFDTDRLKARYDAIEQVARIYAVYQKLNSVDENTAVYILENTDKNSFINAREILKQSIESLSQTTQKVSDDIYWDEAKIVKTIFGEFETNTILGEFFKITQRNEQSLKTLGLVGISLAADAACPGSGRAIFALMGAYGFTQAAMHGDFRGMIFNAALMAPFIGNMARLAAPAKVSAMTANAIAKGSHYYITADIGLHMIDRFGQAYINQQDIFAIATDIALLTGFGQVIKQKRKPPNIKQKKITEQIESPQNKTYPIDKDATMKFEVNGKPLLIIRKGKNLYVNAPDNSGFIISKGVIVEHSSKRYTIPIGKSFVFEGKKFTNESKGSEMRVEEYTAPQPAKREIRPAETQVGRDYDVTRQKNERYLSELNEELQSKLSGIADGKFAVLAVGSHSRFESGLGRESPVEIIIVHKNLARDQLGLIKEALAEFKNTDGTEIFDLRDGHVEVKNLNNPKESFMRHSRTRAIYPERVLESYNLFGPLDIQTSARTRVADEVLNEPEQVVGNYARVYTDYKSSLYGTQDSRRIVHFEIDAQNQGVVTVYFDPATGRYGFKYGPLRFIQTAGELVLPSSILYSRKGQTVGINDDYYKELLLNAPSQVPYKLEFLSSEGILQMHSADARQIGETYKFFLGEQHRLEQNYYDANNPVLIDYPKLDIWPKLDYTRESLGDRGKYIRK